MSSTLRWAESDFREALKHQDAVFQGLPECTGFVTDSRKAVKGAAYIALRGDKNDGNAFAASAAANGAGLLILEHQALQKGLIHKEDFSVPVIWVIDGLKALQSLASYHRNRLTAPVLAITGSNGKTSAKDMAASLAGAILGPDQVLATEGNLNNHIGLPLSLLKAESSHRLIILEMGMNHAGEIQFLSETARPHHALITSIAPAHIEFFKDILGIAAAKLEIVCGLENDGILLYPSAAVGADLALQKVSEYKKRIVYFSAEGASAGPDGIRFRFHNQEIRNPHYYSVPMASNLLAVMLLLEHAGFSREDLIRYASLVKPFTPRRFQIHKLPKRQGEGFLYLADDSYNANESSFLEAVQGLRRLLPAGTLALFAGEMGELGPEHSPAAHRAVGKLAAELGYSYLAVSGKENASLMADAFTAAGSPESAVIRADSAKSLLELLEQSYEIIDRLDGILVKGSRSAGMDLISDAIIKKNKE